MHADWLISVVCASCRGATHLRDSGREQRDEAVGGGGELGGGDGRQRAVGQVLHLRAHHLDALHLRMPQQSVRLHLECNCAVLCPNLAFTNLLTVTKAPKHTRSVRHPKVMACSLLGHVITCQMKQQIRSTPDARQGSFQLYKTQQGPRLLLGLPVIQQRPTLRPLPLHVLVGPELHRRRRRRGKCRRRHWHWRWQAAVGA